MNFGVNIFSPNCVEILYPNIVRTCLSVNENAMVDVKLFNNQSIDEEKSGALLFFKLARVLFQITDIYNITYMICES